MKAYDPKKFDKYLPCGTIVMLNKGIKTMMIMGYQRVVDGKTYDYSAPEGASEHTRKTYDYVAVPFPEGLLDLDSMSLFNHEDIGIITFLGCVSKRYALFDDFLKQKSDKYEFVDPEITKIFEEKK